MRDIPTSLSVIFDSGDAIAGLSLIFQVDGELKKVAGGQKKSGAAVELVAGGVGYS